MRRPDFFIVGAPKSGTTSLKQYLMSHPEVFIPPPPAPPEPHYFHQAQRRFPLDLSEYLSFFENAKADQRVGEKSVWYLYASPVPGRIAEFEPEADIIVMLRNPVDMLYSLHSQLTYNRTENIEVFAEALEAESKRKRGECIPPVCSWSPVLYYHEVGSYCEQLQRYFQVFGRRNVMVLIFDDFVRDTAAAYRKVLQFLGVDEQFQPEFTVHNPNQKPRSRWLMALRANYPLWLKKLGNLAIPSRRVRDMLLRGFQRLITADVERAPMNSKVRRRLQEDFRREIEQLSDLLDRDLMHWVEADSEDAIKSEK